MSGILGVNGSSNSQLLEQLQLLSRQRTETKSGTSTETSQTGEARQVQFESMLEDALSQAGLDESEIDEIRSEVHEALSSALSQSDTTTDPRKAASDAIDSILQEHGIDTEALKQDMKSQAGSMRPPGPPPGGPGGPGGGQGDFGSKVSEALTSAGVDSSRIEEIQSAIDTAVDSAQQSGDNGSETDIKAVVHNVLDEYGVDQDAFDAAMEADRGSAKDRAASIPIGSFSSSAPSILGDPQTSTDSYSWLAGLVQFVDEQA